MQIFSSPKFSIDQWLEQGTRLSFLLFATAILTFFFLFIFYPWGGKQVLANKKEFKQKGTSLYAYEAIGSGGLALRPRHAFGWVARLADELTLLAFTSRPDVRADEAQLLVALKNGKEQQTLPNGRSLFLRDAQQGRGLSFSETNTSLSIKPILLENGVVLVEASRRLLSKEGQTSEEKGEFTVSLQGGIPSRYNPLQQSFIAELKAARCFSQDLLIQKYGGKEYAAWREKSVLELKCHAGSYACFVSEGDFLLYEEGRWRVCAFEGLRRDCPVARVKSKTNQGLGIEAWDESGFYAVPIKISAEQPTRQQSEPELLPSQIKLRSSTAVSCALGKRRMILKQGDWLLKTSAGWRNLRRVEDISLYLHHGLKGELFIFDGIEKQQGRLILKGSLFDETRTQVMPISLAIEEKQSGKTSRKRKTLTPNAAQI